MSALTKNDLSIATLTEPAIRAQLDLILASDKFKNSHRIKALLTYLIDKTLSNDLHALKEQVIGIDVFERPENFNPQEDNIVRVQARRLRKMLKSYYLTAGCYDHVHIEVPKGSYKTQFTLNGKKVYKSSGPKITQAPSNLPRKAREDIDGDFIAQIISVIAAENEMSLATLRPDGYPQANVLSYVNEGLRLYFGTAEDSEKALNIAMNNKVSLTISRQRQEWTNIEGISIGGVARRITDPEKCKNIRQLIFGKYPQVATYALSTRKEAAVFEIEPEFITLLDYSRGFGFSKTLRV